MYLALFMSPWVLMYTLSTLVMNHRAIFRQEGPPVWAKERELNYDGVFDPSAKPRDMARQILLSLDLDGAHNVSAARPDGSFTITRQGGVELRRITFTPSDRHLVVERQPVRMNAWLERWHRRRGYQHDYVLDDLWAISVDLFIVVTIFWVLSGLWMWWELKVTRRLGALCLVGGAAIFTYFLLVA